MSFPFEVLDLRCSFALADAARSILRGIPESQPKSFGVGDSFTTKWPRTATFT
jgi:hypothetical protein